MVNNNQYQHVGDNCWQVAANHASKLVELAVQDLKADYRYAGVEPDGIAALVNTRAQAVGSISRDQAKKLPNYQEVEGIRPLGGSFSPLPGNCQIPFAAVSKQVNFPEELRRMMEETGATRIFEIYLGL